MSARMRKMIIKDDLSTNPPKSGKKLKVKPPLSSARIFPSGVFGFDLIQEREAKRK